LFNGGLDNGKSLCVAQRRFLYQLAGLDQVCRCCRLSSGLNRILDCQLLLRLVTRRTFTATAATAATAARFTRFPGFASFRRCRLLRGGRCWRTLRFFAFGTGLAWLARLLRFGSSVAQSFTFLGATFSAALATLVVTAATLSATGVFALAWLWLFFFLFFLGAGDLAEPVPETAEQRGLGCFRRCSWDGRRG
jgi:hypothetical protein